MKKLITSEVFKYLFFGVLTTLVYMGTRLLIFSLTSSATFILDLALAFFLVTKFPHIIGQFVNDNISMINAIETLFSQVLIIVFNYVLSKLLVFKDKK